MTKRKPQPTWSLILGLYAIAAIFLIVVRDEIGTENDLQLKAGGWIALTFAVYWSFRAVLAWLVRPAAPAPGAPPTS